MALDGVTSFLRLKDVKYMLTYATWPKYWREFFSAKAESWKKLKTSISRLVCAFVVRKPPKTCFLSSRPNYVCSPLTEKVFQFCRLITPVM